MCWSLGSAAVVAVGKKAEQGEGGEGEGGGLGDDIGFTFLRG